MRKHLEILGLGIKYLVIMAGVLSLTGAFVFSIGFPAHMAGNNVNWLWAYSIHALALAYTIGFFIDDYR